MVMLPDVMDPLGMLIAAPPAANANVLPDEAPSVTGVLVELKVSCKVTTPVVLALRTDASVFIGAPVAPMAPLTELRTSVPPSVVIDLPAAREIAPAPVEEIVTVGVPLPVVV